MNNEYVQEVAGRIIEQLKQGTAAWQKPWKPGELQLPYNAATGKEYRGMNTLWLHMQGYGDPRWMTYKQAEAAGAQVRKGSKGTRVIYWKFYDELPMKDGEGKPVLDGEGKPMMTRVELERPRSFSAVVFNAEQVDGLPTLEVRAEGPEPERHARAEAILANSGAKISHVEGNSAYYMPGNDSITLPMRQQFTSSDAFYATALHELGHWTGHASRLDRDLSHPFGSEGYAREELRAEIASLMLGERLEIGHDPGQHAAYVGSWIKVLEDDPREIFRAASDAERIRSYVMGFEHEQVREQAQASVQIGERVAFTPNEAGASVQAVEGVVVDIAATSTGNLRYRIRSNEISPQDGERQEWLVYSNQGRIERAPLNAGPTPEAAAALDAAHRDAIPDYSPLETWQILDETARNAGFVASVRVNPAVNVAEGRAHFLVSYSRPDGAPTAVGTGIFLDGKAVTGIGNERLSRFISNDTDSLRDTLLVAFNRENERAKPVQHETPEASSMTPTRTYLAVPYRDKNEAKAKGAKWDKEAKAWYAPEGVDVHGAGLARWLPENNAEPPKEVETPEAAFAKALKAEGLIVKGAPVMDGTIHRVPVDGDKGGEKSGAYAGHTEGRIPAGYIQNYKKGTRINWKHEGKIETLSAEERARMDRENAERAQLRAAEIAAKHEQTAKIVTALWSEAPAATSADPYCAAKGISNPGENGLRIVPKTVSDEATAAGVRIAKTVREARQLREKEPEARVFLAGDLLVPAFDVEGKLWTLQTVNPNFKGFVKDGRKAGLFTVAGAAPSAFFQTLENDQSSPLVFAEGYATGDTVARLAGGPCLVTFDSGNIDAVVRQFRERDPDRPLLIASDNDHRAALEIGADGKPKPNVGLVKSQAAAEAHGAGVMVPSFEASDKGSDWNDFAKTHGDDAARSALASEMAKAKTEAAMATERLMTLARQREMEARNDPTTSTDDARVAGERAAAHDLMARAIAGNEEVRGEANDALASGATSLAAVKSGVDRATADLQDEVNEQRELVLHGADRGEAERPKVENQPKRRARDYDAGL